MIYYRGPWPSLDCHRVLDCIYFAKGLRMTTIGNRNYRTGTTVNSRIDTASNYPVNKVVSINLLGIHWYSSLFFPYFLGISSTLKIYQQKFLKWHRDIDEAPLIKDRCQQNPNTTLRGFLFFVNFRWLNEFRLFLIWAQINLKSSK